MFLKRRCDCQVTYSAIKKCKSKKPPRSHLSGALGPGRRAEGQRSSLGGKAPVSSPLVTQPHCPSTSSEAEHRPGKVWGHVEGCCLADEQVQLRGVSLRLQTGFPGGPLPARARVLPSKVNIQDARTGRVQVFNIPKSLATGIQAPWILGFWGRCHLPS